MTKTENQPKRKKTVILRVLTVFLVLALAAGIILITTRSWAKPDDPETLEEIDLTAMSSTMVYAYVYDMLYTKPEAYLGKTVKARGKYYNSYDEKTGNTYHFVIIEDATACCAQGLELRCEGGYPIKNTTATATGVFGVYEENGVDYYYIEVSAFDA